MQAISTKLNGRKLTTTSIRKWMTSVMAEYHPDRVSATASAMHHRESTARRNYHSLHVRDVEKCRLVEAVNKLTQPDDNPASSCTDVPQTTLPQTSTSALTMQKDTLPTSEKDSEDLIVHTMQKDTLPTSEDSEDSIVLFSSMASSTSSRRKAFTAEEEQMLAKIFRAYIREKRSPRMGDVRRLIKEDPQVASAFVHKSEMQIRDKIRNMFAK